MNVNPETAAVVNASLDGALFRYQLGAMNIANVNTGNFRQQVMDFEAYLQAVAEEGSIGQTPDPAQYVSAAAENSGLEKVVAEMAGNTLFYEAVLTGWEKYVGTLRMAITDGKG